MHSGHVEVREIRVYGSLKVPDLLAECDDKVHVFDLEDHPSVTRAYAWASPIESSDKRRFIALLQFGAIQSPWDAVREAA